MKKVLKFALLYSLIILALSACLPVSHAAGVPSNAPDATPQEVPAQPAIREAQVESVEVQVSKTEPVQYWALVHGYLSESCSKLTDPQISVTDNTFQIKVLSLSPTDRGCIQITTPFEQMLALDTANLSPGTYTVVVNGVSAVFTIEGGVSPVPTSLQLVVLANDGSFQVVNVDVPLNPTTRPTFNTFLPYGGGAEGTAYVLDANQAKAIATDGKSFHDLTFIERPTSYGLAVYTGSIDNQPRLAWGTGYTQRFANSTLQISAADGSGQETLLTQDVSDPLFVLVAEFFSADGKWLYFSKEPVGIGGYILFSGGSNLYKINIATKQVDEVIPQGSASGPQACLDAISVDYRYVADHCAQNTIAIRDLTSGGTTTIQPPADLSGYGFVGSARFSPDSTRVAYALGKGDQNAEQGWVAVTDGLSGASKLILTSQVGSYYTVAGWLDNETLLVQSTNMNECSPYCKSELWTVLADGSEAQKVTDGSFLAAIPNDAFIQLPASELPTPVAAECQDAAQYIHDDGLDGTTYAPNTAFMKTWTVKNTGSCTWDSRYLVFQISGAFMTQQPGYWLVPPENTVEPGQTVDIHVGMTSPPAKGNYKSYWGLKNEDGKIIPIEGGADGNSFYVEVKVNDGSVDTGAVTATAIDIVPEQGSGDACTADSTYFVHAYITTDGPTTASYEIGSTAGQIPAGYFEDENGQYLYVTGDLVFDKADTKQINLRFVGPYPHPDDITVNLRVSNGEWINAKLFCP